MHIGRRTLCSAILSGLMIHGAAFAAPATEIDMYYPVSASGPIAKIVQDLINDFQTENPDVKVNAIYSGTFDETLSKALTAHKAGKPPAIAHILSAQLFTLLEADALAAYDDIRQPDGNKDWLKSYFPALTRNGMYKGKTYGVPLQRSVQIWYWNKEAFKEAGLDPERGPKNWDEVIAFGKKLVKRDASGNVVRWGVQVPASLSAYWTLQSLSLQNGADISTDEAKLRLNTPEAVGALTWWRDLATVHKIMAPGVIEWGTSPRDFIEGRTAMLMTTTGNLGFFRTNAKFEFGASPLPGNKAFGTPTGGGNLYIFKGAPVEQQQAAARLARWLGSPERAAEWAVKTGYIATTPAAYDTARMKEHVAKFPQYTVARDQLATAVRELSTYRQPQVTNEIDTNVQGVLSGTKTPKAALDEAQQKVDRVLSKYR